MIRSLFTICILLLSLYSNAGPAQECVRFYSPNSSAETHLGPIATEMKNVFLSNDMDVASAFQRLNKNDQDVIKKEIERDQAFAKELLGLPLEEAAINIKRLIKNRILFSKIHENAFDGATQPHLIKIEPYWGETYFRKEERTSIIVFQKMLDSQNPEDQAKIATVVSRIESSLRGNLQSDKWEILTSAQRAEFAQEKAKQLKVRFSADFLKDFEQIQQFFQSSQSTEVLQAVIRRALPTQAQTRLKGKIPTWKTLTSNLSASAGSLGTIMIFVPTLFQAEHYALGTVSALGTAGLVGASLMSTLNNKPGVRDFFEKIRGRRNGIRKEKEYVATLSNEQSLKVIEDQIKADELREDKDDVNFSLILNELESGISSHGAANISLWGKEFQRGFINVAQRHSALDKRMEIISDELTPVAKGLDDGQSSSVDLKQSSTYLQNLFLDAAFLRNDYLALALALDRYVTQVNEYKNNSGNDLSDTQLKAIEDKMQRLYHSKEMLVLSAERTQRLLKEVMQASDIIHNYHEKVVMKLLGG